jgi:hypothetical protein
MSEQRPSPFDPTPSDFGPEEPCDVPGARKVLSYPSVSVLPLTPKERGTDARVPLEEVKVETVPDKA